MISLLINHLASALSQYEPMRTLTGLVEAQSFPVEAEGLPGALLPLVAERVSSGRSCLLIVPTEAEAGEMVEDLAVFQPEAGRGGALFPAWGALPYGDGRPPPAVAGGGASVLARLLAGGAL